MTDPRNADTSCERLGDLAASLTPGDGRLPDATGWALIGRRLDRTPWRSPRRLLPALALLTFALVGAGGYVWARRPLGYRVQDCAAMRDAAVCATAGGVVFSDGTSVVLEARSSLHIRPATFARGAELSLDDGDAKLAVVHRPGAHWAVLAGPFRVEVTGTRFRVRWSKAQQVLDVAVTEGEVHVSGGTLSKAAILRSGQSLHADASPRGDVRARKNADQGSREPTGTTAASTPSEEETSAPGKAGTGSGAGLSVGRTGAVLPRSRRHAEAKVDSASASLANDTPDPTVGAAPPATESDQPGTRQPPGRAPSPTAEEASWARADSLGLPAPAPAASAKVQFDQVVFAADGRLAGGMTGSAWLDRGTGTRLSTPVSREKHAHLQLGPDGLCTSGTVAALRCVNPNIPEARCDWNENWGVVIGFDVKAGGRAWGDEAAQGIAVEFHGRFSSYRLNAHRKDDPYEKNYCIEDYKSGRMVTPGMFRTRCWEDSGDTLATFKDVDLFNLQLQSGMEYVAFHYCVSGIRLER